MFFKTTILKHFTKFPGNHPWWSVFLAKIKKRIYSHRYFLGNFLKVFRKVLLTLPGDCFRPGVFFEIAVLKYLRIFLRNHYSRSVLLDKI